MNNETITIKTYALIKNSMGEPGFFEKDITLSREAYDNGDHYDAIEAATKEDGYEFISAFDEHDDAGRQLAARSSNVATPMASELAGALANCIEQIHQMKGMFDDEDGTIQEALDAAEEALNRYHDAPKVESAPQQVHVALRLDGDLDAIAFTSRDEGQKFLDAQRYGYTQLLETGIYPTASEALDIWGADEKLAGPAAESNSPPTNPGMKG